jgi:hypothetical protein
MLIAGYCMLLAATDARLTDRFSGNEFFNSGCFGPPYRNMDIKGIFSDKKIYSGTDMRVSKTFGKRGEENVLRFSLRDTGDFEFFYFYRRGMSLPVNNESVFSGKIWRDRNEKILLKAVPLFTANDTNGKIREFDFRPGGYLPFGGLGRVDDTDEYRFDIPVWKEIEKICNAKKYDLNSVRFIGYGILINGKIGISFTFDIGNIEFETPGE